MSDFDFNSMINSMIENVKGIEKNIYDSESSNVCYFCNKEIEKNTKECLYCGKPHIPYIPPKEEHSGKRKYRRKTAEEAVKYAHSRAIEVNNCNEYIYRVSKMVVFGSLLDKTKEYVGDVDIALYLVLKDETKNSADQSIEQYKRDLRLGRTRELPFIQRLIYAKEKTCQFIKGKKRVIELHDGFEIDRIATLHETANYIYLGEYQIYPL